MILNGLKTALKYIRSLASCLKPAYSYGILKACKRCVYQKSHEPILIVSQHRGPRVIIYPFNSCYVRLGECVGLDKCGKCFSIALSNEHTDATCKWLRFK